jgi:hypothetical protein
MSVRALALAITCRRMPWGCCPARAVAGYTRDRLARIVPAHLASRSAAWIRLVAAAVPSSRHLPPGLRPHVADRGGRDDLTALTGEDPPVGDDAEGVDVLPPRRAAALCSACRRRAA